MAYTKTTWVNDQQPDIDADNLNKMEQGIYDAQFPDGGTEGQLLARTANGQGWVDPPNSAVWGGITGDIADQTDLQAALSSVGKVDSVNGIQPDVLTKNVQVDVEITKQGWDALPSTKYTDDINYYIKDGTNIPQAGVISASGVTYSNTSSGLDATTVQGAIDENASEIADVKAGLTAVTDEFAYIRGYFANSADWTAYNAYPAGFNRTNCSIVGFEVYNADSWKNGIGYTATQNARTFAAMDNNGVRVYNTDTVLFGEVYRITLRKLTI